MKIYSRLHVFFKESFWIKLVKQAKNTNCWLQIKN